MMVNELLFNMILKSSDCNGNMLCPIFDVRIAIKDRIVESLVDECQLEPPTTTTQSTTTMEAEILTSSAALSVNCPEEQGNRLYFTVLDNKYNLIKFGKIKLKLN